MVPLKSSPSIFRMSMVRQSRIGPFGGFSKARFLSSSFLTELVVEVNEDLDTLRCIVGESILFSFSTGERPVGLF